MWTVESEILVAPGRYCLTDKLRNITAAEESLWKYLKGKLAICFTARIQSKFK